jgi:hypothetical protein
MSTKELKAWEKKSSSNHNSNSELKIWIYLGGGNVYEIF